MEFYGPIVVALLPLAILGVVTLAAIPLMAVMSLLTEMSFKRVFFTSFALALLAPILLGVAIGSAVEDGSLQREIQSEFRDAFSESDLSESELEEIRNVRDALTPERREQIEQFFEERPELRQILPPELSEIIQGDENRPEGELIEGNAEPVESDPDPDADDAP